MVARRRTSQANLCNRNGPEVAGQIEGFLRGKGYKKKGESVTEEIVRYGSGLVYLASSWQNKRHPEVVSAIRAAGFRVYDYRHEGFSWEKADASDDPMSAEQMSKVLAHPEATAGFGRDLLYLGAADVCVLLLPSGNSAHLELGFVAGGGKPTAILMDGPARPDLMYKVADLLTEDLNEILQWLKQKVPVAQQDQTILDARD